MHHLLHRTCCPSGLILESAGKGKGQEGLRKDAVNTVSLRAEDIAVWPR